MSKTDPDQTSVRGGPDSLRTGKKTTPADADDGRRRRRGGILSLLSQIREAGREVAAIARGQPLDPPAGPDDSDTSEAPDARPIEKSNWRVNMMHAATERLRGAADNYIAAKLDEIEARVDAKLDSVETRIDAKIVELHRQLRRMRDRELRHRLRLLKITLVFTVLVAILSLGYKLLSKYLPS